MFFLVANKRDLEHMRVIKREKHEKFAKEKEMSHFCVSAKSGEDVRRFYTSIKSFHLNLIFLF